MPEDNSHDAIIGYDATRFCKCSGDHLVVVRWCPVVNIAATLDNSFLIFLLDTIGVGSKGEPRRGRDQRPLQPDKE
jgi:hypothetical protein